MQTEQETTTIENHLNNQANQDQHVEQLASNVSGSVKWFNRIKGYGFVTRDDTKEDIFVHFSGVKPVVIKNNLRQSKRRVNLFDQEKVIFDVVKNGEVKEARNVVGKNGYLLVDQITFKRGVSPLNTQIINDTRLTGKVKWFNVKTRYGYVQCDYNNEDIYVNSTSIVKNNPNKYIASLANDEIVEFDILKRPNGRLEAVNVTGPNGESVVGSVYSPDKVDKTKQNFIETNVQGKVKWFNLRAGFGYITRNDNGKDVYVHYTSVANKNPNHRLRSLGDGELVQFNIVDSDKGDEAVDVTGLNGQPVIGSERADRNSSRRRNDNDENGQRGRRGRISGPGRGRRGRGPIRNDDGDMDRRRPRQPRSTSGGRPPMGRMGGRGGRGGGRGGQRRGPSMNIRNNYAPNPYNTNNYYDNTEPLFYTFKPKNTLPYESNEPRRMSFDRYMNMVNRPAGKPRVRGPPRNYQEQSIPNSNSGNLMILEKKIPGFCKWFNYVRGFGYVTRYDNREDIYVHRTAIQRTLQNGVMASLDDGEPVEFDICRDQMNNTIAVNVTGPNNTAVKGSRYANASAGPKQQQQRSPVQTKVYRRRRMVN